MFQRIGLAVTLITLAWTGSASAGDHVVRLGGTSAETMTLGGAGDAATIDVRWCRPRCCYSYCAPRVYSCLPRYTCYPRYFCAPACNYYVPRCYVPPVTFGYYGSPCLGSSFSLYFSPIGTSLAVAPRATILTPPPAAVPADPNDRTYPYDGGPSSPVPMPRVMPKPSSAPPATTPIEGRLVSVTDKTATPKKKYQYGAYGEDRQTQEKWAGKTSK